jgi:exodeoxyribonuclease V gamma subunit
MAFTLYQSNRQEDLFTLFAAVLQQPHTAAVLTPEKVIIPSQGMAKWLTMTLAEETGIAANMSFELPAAFAWSLVRTFLPTAPEQSMYRIEVLAWRIYQLLTQHTIKAASIEQYLSQADTLRTYQLAERVATLFDQYLVYRADWLTHWENHRLVGLGEDEAWQAALWQGLVKEDTLHRANLFAQVLTWLDTCPKPLPSRIFCFGVSNLPPIYLALLQKLGEVTEVHYFVLNPCQENWIDDRDYLEQLRLAGREDPEQLYLELGHPLLTALAKQGRDFFASLAALPSFNVFAEAEEICRDTLLQRIQADILCRSVQEPLPCPPDETLHIHACHSPMREIEVLQDTLLHWLQIDPSLNPSDILVVAPDIEVYIPYIDAVFSAPDTPVQLPFSVADKNPLQHTALFSLFLALLSLPTQRFEVAWVLDTINHPVLLRRFGLQMSHMPLLREWVNRVNIVWGRDGAHKQQYGLPEDPLHTWRHGLERLLLACALPQEMANDALPVFAGRFPGETIGIIQRDILAGFVTLMETLMHYAERLATDQSPEVWITELFTLIETCFAPDEEEEKELLQIQSHLADIAAEVEQANMTSAVSIDVMGWLLQQRLKTPSTQGFLGRGITFCNMVPLRALPARIICVLGLNHDTFPRQSNPMDMDLMAHYPRLGDRSRRQDDRYLFLETLLSARDRLYISYLGQDIRTNQSLPPSVIVDEFLDVVDNLYPLGKAARECLVTKHALQPFNAQYFQKHQRYQSFQRTWLQVAQTQYAAKHILPGVFTTPLPEAVLESPLTLGTLLRFYRHPTRFLLQNRLDILLPRQERKPTPEISVLLNQRQRRQVRARILQYQHHAQHILRLEGVLPGGAFGEYPYQEEHTQMRQWLQKSEIHCQTEIYKLPLLQIKAWQILAVLPRVNNQYGIILHSLHEFPNACERMIGWLQHLLLCIAAPGGVCLTTTVGSLSKQYRYEVCGSDEASTLLLPWLDYLQQGMHRPLPFFVQTSLCFAEQIYRGKSIKEAKKSAQQLFLPGFNAWAEGGDPYLTAAYQGIPELGEAFIEVAQTLLLPMLQHQREPHASA